MFEIQGLYPLRYTPNRAWSKHSEVSTLEEGVKKVPKEATHRCPELSWRLVDLSTGLVVYPEEFEGERAYD